MEKKPQDRSAPLDGKEMTGGDAFNRASEALIRERARQEKIFTEVGIISLALRERIHQRLKDTSGEAALAELAKLRTEVDMELKAIMDSTPESSSDRKDIFNVTNVPLPPKDPEVLMKIVQFGMSQAIMLHTQMVTNMHLASIYKMIADEYPRHI